ncbi:hypothetical protein BaRGS_00009674, partial [Batillaria attramentaria]
MRGRDGMLAALEMTDCRRSYLYKYDGVKNKGRSVGKSTVGSRPATDFRSPSCNIEPLRRNAHMI